MDRSEYYSVLILLSLSYMTIYLIFLKKIYVHFSKAFLINLEVCLILQIVTD